MTIKDFENKLNDAIGNTYQIGYNNLILSSANLIKENDKGQTYKLNINFITQNECAYLNAYIDIDICDLYKNYGLYIIMTDTPLKFVRTFENDYNSNKTSLISASLDVYYYVFLVICDNNNDIKHKSIKAWRKIIWH